MLPAQQRHCGLQTPGKPNWICTLMWSAIVVVIGLGSVKSQPCMARDLMSLQKPCRSENDDLVSYVGTNHTQKLCSALTELWFCVAQHVPRCFHNMTVIYQHLTHSPHNCRLSDGDFLKIQKIITDNELKESSASSISTTTPAPRKHYTEQQDDVIVDITDQNENSGSSIRHCDQWIHLVLVIFALVQTSPAVI